MHQGFWKDMATFELPVAQGATSVASAEEVLVYVLDAMGRKSMEIIKFDSTSN